MAKVRLSRLERRRFAVMLFCLLIAIFAWMFLTLNKNYVYNVKTAVKYTSLPQKKAFHPLQSDTVELQVEGSGWQLLFAKMRINPPSISANLRTLNTKDYISFTDQLVEINKKLESTQKIISIVPDTLYFDFSRRIEKKVPIILNSRLSFKKPYRLSDTIQLFPKEVKIIGPEEDLKKINYWRTDSLVLENISSNINKTLKLKAMRTSNVVMEPSAINVKISVDEFTEKVVEVPVKIINNINFYKVDLYPKKVKIKFLVSLENYEDIDQNFIEASVDLNDWQVHQNPQLVINLTRFPDYCKLVSISPQKIDFLIHK